MKLTVPPQIQTAVQALERKSHYGPTMTSRYHLYAIRVAEAADAWLTDPLDTNIYDRLVAATLRWRQQAHPQLEITNPPPTTNVPTVGEGLQETVEALRQTHHESVSEEKPQT